MTRLNIRRHPRKYLFPHVLDYLFKTQSLERIPPGLARLLVPPHKLVVFVYHPPQAGGKGPLCNILMVNEWSRMSKVTECRFTFKYVWLDPVISVREHPLFHPVRDKDGPAFRRPKRCSGNAAAYSKYLSRKWKTMMPNHTRLKRSSPIFI